MDEREHQWHDFPTLPRLTILPWLIWALFLVSIVTGGIRLAYGAEESADVAQYEQVSVYLYNKPCVNKIVLGRLEERVHKAYRAGEAFHKSLGHRELCYLRLEAYDAIFILDEHGGMADLPKSDFKPWKGNTKPKPGQVGV
jgi:hypothetical protein